MSLYIVRNNVLIQRQPIMVNLHVAVFPFRERSWSYLSKWMHTTKSLLLSLLFSSIGVWVCNEMWKTKSYLAMKTDFQDELISSDLNDLVAAANKLAHDLIMLGVVSGFGISLLKFIASISAMYVIFWMIECLS